MPMLFHSYCKRKDKIELNITSQATLERFLCVPPRSSHIEGLNYIRDRPENWLEME